MQCREGISFELVLARADRGQRREQEREHWQHQHEQDQRHCVVAGNHHRIDTQSGIKPRLRLEEAEQRQETQRNPEHHQNALDDVLELEVAELVGQNGLDLFRRQAREQGIEEHDPLGGAESGKIGIAVRAALGAIHHEQAL